MIITHKPIPLKVLRVATLKGCMNTLRGIKQFNPGDYIVQAPTGCTWPIKATDVDQFYTKEYTDKEELANMLESLLMEHYEVSNNDNVFDDIHDRSYNNSDIEQAIIGLRK